MCKESADNNRAKSGGSIKPFKHLTHAKVPRAILKRLCKAQSQKNMCRAADRLDAQISKSQNSPAPHNSSLSLVRRESSPSSQPGTTGHGWDTGGYAPDTTQVETTDTSFIVWKPKGPQLHHRKRSEVRQVAKQGLLTTILKLLTKTNKQINK